MYRLQSLLVAAALTLAGCSPPAEEGGAVQLNGYRAATGEDLRAEGWRTDLSRLGVPLEAIRTAGLSPSAFVPIRAPRYAAAATLSLDPAEPLLVFRGETVVHAWPLAPLVVGELALDEVDGVPMAVTFCSLCSTARVLDRRLDGKVLELAVSGLLLEGNSLLFDRETESLWRQIDGTAIAGAYTGRCLAEVPSFVLSFGELRRARPDARVMIAPEPVADPPFARISAEDIVRGEPPAWLSLSCPRPLETAVAAGGAERMIPVAGTRVENLEDVVVFRDPTCAAPHRSGAGDPGAITGSAAVFRREVGGRTLTFDPYGVDIVDRETGSRWSMLGEAHDGPLAGRTLEVVPQVQGFRYALGGEEAVAR
jgi:hypothetical protein